MTASHRYLNDPFRGMSPEDRARAAAFQANQQAIQARRETAARRLLAPTGPAQAVHEAWGPLRDALEARKAQAVPGGQQNAAEPGGGQS